MIKESVKFQSASVFEGMTSLRALLRGRDSGVSDRPIHTVLYDREKLHKIAKDVGYLKAVSAQYGYTIEECDADKIASLTVGTSHGGLIALTGERTLPILDAAVSLPADGFFAYVDGIEDPYNFGYAIRSLYACGVDGILLGTRNWMSAAGVVCRSSAGASELLPLYTAPDVPGALDTIHAAGYRIVCAEEKSEDTLGKCGLKLPLLLVVGGEKRGIGKAVLERADILVRIPYRRSFGASLSAASAATMFAYEIARQNEK